MEKNSIFWGNHENFPGCYADLAQTSASLEKFDESAELYEKAILAYEKYLPGDHGNIALVHLRASFAYSILGNNKMVLEHAGIQK